MCVYGCVCAGAGRALSNEQHIHLMGLTFNQSTYSLSSTCLKNTAHQWVRKRRALVRMCVNVPAGGQWLLIYFIQQLPVGEGGRNVRNEDGLRSTHSPSSHENTWISWIRWLSLSCVTPHLTLHDPLVILSCKMTCVGHGGATWTRHQTSETQLLICSDI